MIISIANDYSPMPAGRYKGDGKFNAEEFRDNILIPKLSEAIKMSVVLEVRLDGMLGISSSFLEEAFGGLVRTKLFKREQLSKHLVIASNSRAYEWAKLDAEQYLEEAFASQDAK
jgi:hypothetical protein